MPEQPEAMDVAIAEALHGVILSCLAEKPTTEGDLWQQIDSGLADLGGETLEEGAVHAALLQMEFLGLIVQWAAGAWSLTETGRQKHVTPEAAEADKPELRVIRGGKSEVDLDV